MKGQTPGEVPVVHSSKQILIIPNVSWEKMENMRGAPILPPATAAYPKSHPLPWGSGNTGKPHRAAKFIARTKADATFAILCPRAAVEGSSVDLQKYLRKTSSDCNKHKQQTS